MKTIQNSSSTIRPQQWMTPSPAVSGTTIEADASFEIVFKIQETCNLNCSYCYMYNMGNELFRDVPTSAPLEVCIAVADMIAAEFKLRKPRYANLVLHGGEPMLMPPHRFRERMEAIRTRLALTLPAEDLARIHFILQSNGTLVTPEWVSLLSEYNILVGVTIDGPREYHDRVRVDHQGLGSYDRVVAGVAQLREAAAAGRIEEIACLMVIDPEVGGARAYDHLTKELGFTSIDLLLPFRDWDTYDPDHAGAVGRFLAEAFRRWIENEDGVKVRLFSRAIASMLRPQRDPRCGEQPVAVNHHYIVVESDGSIMPDETVRTRVKERFSELNVRETSFSDVFSHTSYLNLTVAGLSFPSECADCALSTSCYGGRALTRVGSRFSSTDGFHNRTVHCESLIPLYAEVYRFLSASENKNVHNRLEAAISTKRDTTMV